MYQTYVKLMIIIDRRSNKCECLFTRIEKEEDVENCCDRGAHDNLMCQELKGRDTQLQEHLCAVQPALRPHCSGSNPHPIMLST